MTTVTLSPRRVHPVTAVPRDRFGSSRTTANETTAVGSANPAAVKTPVSASTHLPRNDMSIPTGVSERQANHASFTDLLTQILEHLDTPTLDAVVADLTIEEVTAEDLPDVCHIPGWTRDDYARGLRQERAARAVHRLATALLIDGLLAQTAGSGIAETDAQVLVGVMMDEYDIEKMRRHVPTPRERMRRQWDAMRHRVSPVIFERDGYQCFWCSTTENLTVDHATPIHRDGTNDQDNLMTCCSRCNSRKGRKTFDEYVAYLSAQEAVVSA